MWTEDGWQAARKLYESLWPGSIECPFEKDDEELGEEETSDGEEEGEFDVRLFSFELWIRNLLIPC